MMNEMAQLDGLDDESFRRQFRSWLDSSYPEAWKQDFRRPFRRLRGDDATAWIKCLAASGWRCPAWPIEFGGMGLGFGKQVIYQQEMERIRAARIVDLGEVQLGPILMQLGSAEQQQMFLPGIRSGEQIWCQGYSEPGAGSDLASLRTTADREGDHLRVNGQKIWTTHANEATHMFALVRTSKGERKQQGISFILIDMNTPGITVRPIDNLAGEDEFCEVFFDDARVPIGNVVGGVDEGWTVAKALLNYERIWIGSPALVSSALRLSRELINNSEPGPVLKDRYAMLCMDLHDHRALYAQICGRIAAGEEPGPDVSLLKMNASELLQRVAELNVDLSGDAAAIDGDVTIGQLETDPGWQYFMSRPGTIFAGSNEIQRNLIAKTILGLGI